MIRNQLLIGVVLLTALAASLGAQTAATEILGVVTDSTGAVVQGAKVTITRVATNFTRTGTTDHAGEYSFPLLDIGEYIVRCEMQGFKIRTVTSVRLQTQQKLRVDLALELGNVTETVSVTAAAVSLKTEDATIGQVIENRRITELPLNGRNISNLAVLVPGVQFGLRTGLADGGGGFPIPGAGVSVIANGIREVYGTIALDGVDAKNPRTHITVFTPSIEAIEEFKVQTSSYSAEYGLGGGAHVTISMKSGTNRLRGTLFEFLRNDKLDAEDYFLNFDLPAGTARLPKDRLRRNQFGAVVSGPVVLPGYDGRNRTFWAFNYEGRRETKEGVSSAFFPPDAFRQGNFSALLAPGLNSAGRPLRAPIVVFDPLTGDPFPNNQIPSSRIHPGARKVLEFLPRAQFQQADILDTTARSAVPDIIGQNQYYVRGDHLFSDYDKVFVRYAFDRSRRDQSYINPNFPTYYTQSASNLASQWLHTFSQNAINEFRFGFNVADDDIGNPRTNTTFDVDSLGIGPFRSIGDGNRKLTSRETGVPLLTQFTIGDRDTGNGFDFMTSYQVADNFSFHRDRHNFKAGVQYQRTSMDRGSANEPRGSMTFGANESGYNFASLLLGYPTTARSPESLHPTLPLANRGSLYFLDDWKVTPRLTLNLGIRWDYIGVPVDKGGGWRSLSFEKTYTAPDGRVLPIIIPVDIDKKGAIKLWSQEKRFVMPRVGIAYRPGNKWVMRAGGGWFANVEHLNTFTILANMPPFGGSQEFNSVTDAARTIAVTANATNYNISTRRFRPGAPVVSFDDPFGGSATIRPSNLLAILPNHHSPNHWQWSFDIQRELPFETALTIGYVGSKTSNVGNTITNFNSPDPSPDSNFQARRPTQRFYDLGRVQDLAGLRMIDSFGNGFYHGLQASLEKRFTRGLVYGFSYTFSKAHGDGESGGNEDGGFQNPRDRLGSRSRYSFDQTHSAVLHFVYELPFAKGMKGVGGALLSGWQTNGILTMRTGFPMTVTQGQDLNTGSGPVRPDRLTDERLGDEANRRRWFDATAFRRVSCNIPGRTDLCHYGSAGRATFDTPSVRNLDFSAYKNFAIRENMKVQFRAESFNTTNNPYFSSPNGITFSTINSTVPDGPRDAEVRSLRTPMRIIQFGLKFFF
jgi:hypothetical protein